MNIRLKFIYDNLKKAKDKKTLTDWEQQFIFNIEYQLKNGAIDLSQKQFNTLKEIAEK